MEEYTVLIVEDNQVALESLQCTIHWEELGLRLIAVASDGKQGCDMIRLHHPDIVLADIHMPKMDGLAMMEAMQEELEHSRVIFITAYEKIEYASRAIKLSAFDFILKPVDNEELIRSLLRAKQSLDKDRDVALESQRKNAALCRFWLMSALTANSVKKAEDAFVRFAKQKPNGYFLISAEAVGGVTGPMLQRLDFMEMPEGTEIISTVLDGDLVLYCGMLNDTANWQVLARDIAGAIAQNIVELTVAVSNLHSLYGEIPTAYEEVRQTLLRHVIYGRRTAVDFYGSQIANSSKQTRLVDLEQVCGKLAQNIDSITAEQVWQTVMEKSSGKLRIVRIMLMFFCTKAMQEKLNSPQWVDTMDITVYDITKLDTLDSARAWLERFFDELKKVKVTDIDPQTGLAQYQRVEENGTTTIVNTLTDATLGNGENSYVNIGLSRAPYWGGFTNTFNYKNWELYVHMAYNLHYKVVNTLIQDYTNGRTWASRNLHKVPSRWKIWEKPGDQADIPMVNADPSFIQDLGTETSFAYMNASHLRISTIRLSYSFPQKWLRTIPLQSALLSVSVDNVHTFTSKDFAGNDPENAGGWAAPRQIVFGVSATF